MASSNGTTLRKSKKALAPNDETSKTHYDSEHSASRNTVDLDEDCPDGVKGLELARNMDHALKPGEACQKAGEYDMPKTLTRWMDAELKAPLHRVEEKLNTLMFFIPDVSNSATAFASHTSEQRSHFEVPAEIEPHVHKKSKQSKTSYARFASGINQLMQARVSGNESGKSCPLDWSSNIPSNQGSVRSRTSFSESYRPNSSSPTQNSHRSSGAAPRNTFSISMSRKFRHAQASKMTNLQLAIRKYQNPRGECAAEVWRFFENRYSGKLASLYALLTPWIVIGSVLLSFWQTVDGCPLDGIVGEALQTCFESLFALELIIRCLVCPDRWQFCKDFLNVIDLCSAAPIVFRIVMYIRELDGNRSASAKEIQSVIAMVPVLRLLKLTRRFDKFQILLSAGLIALEALPVLLYSLVVIALLFSAMFFYAEPSDNVRNLPEALWFILVTMTTVGYGDVTPETPVGHMITVCLMLISGLFLAMPIGIVGNAFSQAWSARDRLLLMYRMREAFTRQGFSAKSLETIVNLFDGDCDGALCADEFTEMLETMRIHISPERVQLLLEELDLDGNGTVTVPELMKSLFPQDYSDIFAGLKQATEQTIKRQQSPLPRPIHEFSGSENRSTPSHLASSPPTPDAAASRRGLPRLAEYQEPILDL